MTAEQLLFEQSIRGRRGYSLPECDVPSKPATEVIPDNMLRSEAPHLPELAEPTVVRHFTRLSRRAPGVDSMFYPLGSCTMKYNPKRNESWASMPGLLRLHPYQPEESVQGVLQILYDMEKLLATISGMDRVSLQPAAGAHGELASLMMIRAYHDDIGAEKSIVLIPDSAHGTNPASSTLCGYKVREIESDEKGMVSIADLRKKADASVAAIMITYPDTLGLLEENILEIAGIVHECGGLVYMDGANLNAIMGQVLPAQLGVDVMHFNLHKTFSTPHGGGGPGAGPIGVKKIPAPFLPVPTVEKDGDRYYINHELPQSIGHIRSFYGNIGVLIRAYAYIMTLGGAGLRDVSTNAVLNANYLLELLRDEFDVPYDGRCMHEFVLSASRQRANGVGATEIAKRLIDFGFHPPTIHFPLIVSEALMIEPTETESRETLEAFAAAMIAVSREAATEPEKVKGAPYTQTVSRVDEVKAARELILRWKGE